MPNYYQIVTYIEIIAEHRGADDAFSHIFCEGIIDP